MSAKKDANWERGYFCAVAVLLRENATEGCANTDATSLFRQGGDWRKADPEDIETFRRHGLLAEDAAHASRIGGEK